VNTKNEIISLKLIYLESLTQKRFALHKNRLARLKAVIFQSFSAENFTLIWSGNPTFDSPQNTFYDYEEYEYDTEVGFYTN